MGKVRLKCGDGGGHCHETRRRRRKNFGAGKSGRKC